MMPEWINVDLRTVKVEKLGKFKVVVADPPWAIHQEVRSHPLTIVVLSLMSMIVTLRSVRSIRRRRSISDIFE